MYSESSPAAYHLHNGLTREEKKLCGAAHSEITFDDTKIQRSSL